MNVVHICASDIVGGASTAANRLHHALNQADVDSKMIVVNKKSNDDKVIKYHNTWLERTVFSRVRSYLDQKHTQKVTSKQAYVYSTAKYGANIANEKTIQEADILHIHWINAGFLSLKSIYKLCRLNKPIVWTMHDMWLFTGGCHYSGKCTKFKEVCDSCYMLNNRYKTRLAKMIITKKIAMFEQFNLVAVGCSHWIAETAKSSSLLKDKNVRVLANCVDTQRYCPVSREEAKQKLGLDINKKYVLFGAINGKSDTRKGYKELKETIKALSKENNALVELLVFGTNDPAVEEDFQLPTTSLGFVNDEQVLAQAYNAASVYVSPSKEDNLPNTMVESLACGTPITAFDIGGIPDLVKHKETGYVAKPMDTEDLAEGITWCLNQDEAMIRKQTREYAVKNYSYEAGAKRYIALYEQLK